MRYVIISDLHIGGGTNLDIFHAHAALAGFIRSLGGVGATLIINGDFIDFLSVPPWEFSRVAAQEKVRDIISSAPNKQLWEAFDAFLGSDRSNRVEVLLGNHDVELVFEEVQEALTRTMTTISGGGDRVHFYDRVSYPKLKVGDVHVHIEHGFQYDTFNWYDFDKLLFTTEHGGPGKDFTLPVGSQLVYTVLNELTPEHPFVPLLKPETAVFWMMVALAPKKVLANLLTVMGLTPAGVVGKLRQMMKGVRFGAPGATPPGAALEGVSAQLVDMLYGDGMTDSDLLDVREFLGKGTGAEFEASRAAITFAASPMQKGQLFLLRRALLRLRFERDSFFDVTREDKFRPALERILATGAKVAVMGHSHGTKMMDLASPTDPALSLLYLNTGTWADLLSFDEDEIATDSGLLGWVQKLEQTKFVPTFIPTFVRLEDARAGRGVKVMLGEWRDGKEHLLAPAREVLP